MVSLLTGLALSSQAIAVDQSNDNLMCAVYMDVAVENLYPLGALPQDRAKQMLLSRFTRLAAINMGTKEPVEDIVSDFISVRSQVRKDLVRSSGLDAMKLDSPAQISNYAKNLDAITTKHCTLSNRDLDKLMKTHTQDDFVKKAIEVSKEMGRQDKSES